MRLIDADTLKKILGTDTKIRETFCKVIDAQPTAYDVEKVVAELEQHTRTMMPVIPAEEAIEIVKRGGIYETNKETHQST